MSLYSLKVVVVGCFYANDFHPGTQPILLERVTKKTGFFRDTFGKIRKVTLARMLRDFSVIPYGSRFESYNFNQPFSIHQGYGAIELGERLYGYSKAQSLRLFLEARQIALGNEELGPQS